MEPRARAGKNVGKMNFGYGELRQLLYGSGDAREPLPETMRLLDEIATDFIQSLSFEAARIGHYAGRQKIKYEDFEFALRRNPLFLGKVREMFEMSKEVKDARKMPGIGEGNLAKADINDLARLGEEDNGKDSGKDKDKDKDKDSKDKDKAEGGSHAGNSKKRASGKGDGTASKKKKAKTAAANTAADEARAANNKAADEARTAASKAPAMPPMPAMPAMPSMPPMPEEVAAKEEPDLDEPSGLDALFGDGDDDELDFAEAGGTVVKNENSAGID